MSSTQGTPTARWLGADAAIVSAHSGRQVDDVSAPISSVLPEIVVAMTLLDTARMADVPPGHVRARPAARFGRPAGGQARAAGARP